VSELRFISNRCLARRAYWIGEIEKISSDFGADARKLERELAEEIARDGEEVRPSAVHRAQRLFRCQADAYREL